MQLVGGKVILREKRIEDAWMDYLWRTDEEIARLDAAYPLKMKFENFRRLQEDQFRYPTPASARFSIDTQEGHYIGNCMYYDFDALNKQAEVGIVIGDKEYWSRSYGYDALVTLLEHIFANIQVDRLYLHTLDWNKRAQRAFEKCGFTAIRNVRRTGLDFVLMDITRRHWMNVHEAKLEARDGGAKATQP